MINKSKQRPGYAAKMESFLTESIDMPRATRHLKKPKSAHVESFSDSFIVVANDLAVELQEEKKKKICRCNPPFVS